jgi:glycosyltransferase involved in cell wall biosynthesis
VREYGLEGKVILPGYITDGEIKALYQGAFGYLFPSENEGFGIPILEAFGFGIPVIHSDQQALLEVAGGAGLAFETGNQADLTEKMILLDRENELRSKLVQMGKMRSKDFSSQHFIEGFHKIILSSTPAP